MGVTTFRPKQIVAIKSASLAADAGILTSQLADGAKIVLKDGSDNIDLVNKAVMGLGVIPGDADTGTTRDSYAATVKYVKDKIGVLSNVLNFAGVWDASAGTFPVGDAGSIRDFYKVSVAGTIGTVEYSVGDNIYANKANATVQADWEKIDNTERILVIGDVAGLQAALDAKQNVIHFVDKETPVGVKDGVNLVFTIANACMGEHVVLEGATLTPGAGNDYTLVGTTLTLLSAILAPEADDNFWISYRY